MEIAPTISDSHLMTSRRFAPLFWTQFLSAFNDNFLKNTLVFLILFTLAADQAASLVTLAGAVFMAPFLLLSALGGEIADRFDKALIAKRLKLAEIAAAAVAVVGIALSSIPVLMVALLMFGVISALFGPIKYGILPDHLERKELPKANAWIEFGHLRRHPRRHHRRRRRFGRWHRRLGLRADHDGAWPSAAGSSAATSRPPARRRPTSSSTRTSSARPGVRSANCAPTSASGAPA